MNEVNSFLEENSALVDKKTLAGMYQQAVHELRMLKGASNLFSSASKKRFEVDNE